MKGITGKTRKMDLVFFIGQMEEFMKASGKMENKMEKLLLL